MRVFSFVPYACDGILVSVEADIRRAIPGIDITGLAAGAVREARERVRAAFRNSNLKFPADRVLINLAPAGIKKDGAGLDLPIALAIMAAAEMVPYPGDIMALGELELSGAVRAGRGVLPAVSSGLSAGIRDFIVPAENASEAALLEEGAICGVNTLEEAMAALLCKMEQGCFPCRHRANGLPEELPAAGPLPYSAGSEGDFSDVNGQARYKRAMEIAMAGGHNLLVFGPPGIGKTMLARRAGSIMAPLTRDEAVEVTKLHSLAGQLLGNGGSDIQPTMLIKQPPFRAPHHSASMEGILGGGKSIRPGEISLAHYGVLFLDEAPEFKVNTLQALREPLEDKIITISRAEGSVRLPAAFQLIMASNPCPCGRLGMNAKHRSAACYCSAHEIERYWKRFGGALLDRIELRVVAQSGGIGKETNETSAIIRKRVIKAVEIQRERFKPDNIRQNTGCVRAPRRNADIGAGMIRSFCPLTAKAGPALKQASEKLDFSGRACYSVLRVARTIADLDGKDTIDIEHILEAVQHRRYGEDPYDVFAAKEDAQ